MMPAASPRRSSARESGSAPLISSTFSRGWRAKREGGEAARSSPFADRTQKELRSLLRQLVAGGFLDIEIGRYGGLTIAQKKRECAAARRATILSSGSSTPRADAKRGTRGASRPGGISPGCAEKAPARHGKTAPHAPLSDFFRSHADRHGKAPPSRCGRIRGSEWCWRLQIEELCHPVPHRHSRTSGEGKKPGVVAIFKPKRLRHRTSKFEPRPLALSILKQ